MIVSRNGRKVTVSLDATEARDLASRVDLRMDDDEEVTVEKWSTLVDGLIIMARATGD